jgi:patatin-like phospholipase/acyl hydrolase
MSRFRILCIDGGGIRGIIPAVVLAELERRTGRPISELFDLIAGTSTGGILALALVKPGEKGRPEYTAEDVIRLYETQGRCIFSRSLLHRVVSLDGLTNKKYQTGPVEKVFEKFFGDALLSDALTNVMVTSFDVQLRDAFFFRSYRARANKEEFDYLMWNAARATSAAPTYFEPELIEKEDKAYALVDGGVFANNPSMCALVDSMREFRQTLDQVFMVSLGTGKETERPLEFQAVKNWGVVNWAQPLLTIVFNGISDTVNYQTDLILNAAGGSQQFYRFQVDLPKSLYRLDNVTPSNIRSLRQRAEKFLETDESEEELTAICKALTMKEPEVKKKSIGRTRRARAKPVAA